MEGKFSAKKNHPEGGFFLLMVPTTGIELVTY
jgi:hypothetical protein